MHRLAKHLPARSVSHVKHSASVEPLLFWGIAGIALPLDGCASSRLSTSCSVVYLSNSSDSTNTNNGRLLAKATDIFGYRELTTISVDLTILLAQQETKHHEPRRPPPGTAIHTLRTRQQQDSTWLSASQSVRGSRRHDFHATPSYIHARPFGSYIARNSESQLEPKAPRWWPEQTWLFV